MARDRDRPDFRRAWQRASEQRERTGDGSDEVLLRFLALEGIELTHPRVREKVLEIWRRGDSPRAATRAMVRLVGVALVDLGRAYWEIYTLFRGSPGSPVLDFVPIDPVALRRSSERWATDDLAPSLRLAEVDLVEGRDSFEVLLRGEPIGHAVTEAGTPYAGRGTLFVRVEDGDPDLEDCWIEQDALE